MKSRLLIAMLTLAFLAGAAQQAPGAAYKPPDKYFIISVQPTPDMGAGKAQADLAFTAGANSLRVIMPWTYPGQADVVNDAPRICSVAAETSSLHMALFLDLVPPFGTDPKPPTTSSQITKYDKTLNDYMMRLIGPNGCAQQLAELDIQVANEPNYSVFWPQAAAAEEYTHLAIRTYKFVQAAVVKHGYSVPVKVVVGELAASHDMKSFMDRMHDEAQKWGYHGPFFDMFSYHCYGTSGSQQPTPPGDMQGWLVADFGQSVPLLCTEYAAPTSARQPVRDVLSAQSESLQAKLFCQGVSLAASQGLAGFGWFRLMDDPTGPPTGLYYYDAQLGKDGDQPVAKTSLPAVTQCLSQAQDQGGPNYVGPPGTP